MVGHEHNLPDCLMEYMLLPIFVESRDLFFEKLSVVRTRADQAHSKGSWWSPARRASGYGSKELCAFGFRGGECHRHIVL